MTAFALARLGPSATLCLVTGRSVEQIAALLRERNEIDRRIAALIGRPMTARHLGEWIASEVFDIE